MLFCPWLIFCSKYLECEGTPEGTLNLNCGA
jgi:hypothetical protein